MNFRCEVRESAEVDLDEGWAYLLEHADLETAARFLTCAESTFDLITQTPNGYSSYNSRLPVASGFRMRPLKAPFGEWLVFYEIVERTVFIARVRHAKEDFDLESV